ADDPARLELVEGRDLPDVVLAVLAGDVADDLVAPLHAEVDVEVGHRDALRVEEALEQELEADRVDVGDAQRPGRHRPGARAAPGSDRDAVALGPVDEVPDDEEVAREPHLHDDAELVGQALAVDVGVEALAASLLLAQAALQALARHLLEVAVQALL